MAAASIPVSARERTAALILLGAATLLRLPYIFHYRINSDEPQHLHVVWGWTRGLLQYRDVSDNHSPLFHLLMAPLLALIGERPDAVVLMRFAIDPDTENPDFIELHTVGTIGQIVKLLDSCIAQICRRRAARPAGALAHLRDRHTPL